MIEFISIKVLEYLISRDALDVNNQEVLDYYRYGVEITLSSITNVLLILVLSAVFDSISNGLIFLIVFIPTRQYTGGYHADSYIRCNAAFGISFICVLILSRFVGAIIPETLLSISLGISTLFVFLFCPVPNRHKPITTRFQYWKCKLIGTLLFGFCSAISVLCLHKTLFCGYIVFFTLHLVAVLGILGFVKERRYRNEEHDR